LEKAKKHSSGAKALAVLIYVAPGIKSPAYRPDDFFLKL
jgi:hypothetical protein